MTDSIRDFIAEADGEALLSAWGRAGFSGLVRAGSEHAGPCPHCGGDDRFSIAPGKGKWNCRGSVGGSSPVGMVAHCMGYDASRREDLVRAAEIVLGRDRPGAAESESERIAREEAATARRRKAEIAAQARAGEADAFRERERGKARGIWDRARPLDGRDPATGYLAARLGLPVERMGRPAARGDGMEAEPRWHLRCDPSVTYWHGLDDLGRPASLHTGTAMIAAILADPLRPAEGDNVIGCHITWIDLANPPKYRPLLPARSGVDGAEALPTKKMRGSKKGGIIPVLGDPAGAVWIGGEGIENGVAAWVIAGFPDAFVFAAGDLGNLAGPGATRGRMKHPLTGKWTPTPQPREDAPAGEAMPVPDHVSDLLLLGDADSDAAATAAMMLRAQRRLARAFRDVRIAWPQLGLDWAQMARAAQTSKTPDAEEAFDRMSSEAKRKIEGRQT